MSSPTAEVETETASPTEPTAAAAAGSGSGSQSQAESPAPIADEHDGASPVPESPSLSLPVYLDYNATTPLHPDVITAITDACRLLWANPSSFHADAVCAREAIETSRERLAALVQANPSDVLFTSGGTECNNWVIRSAIESYSGNGRPHIITSCVEHPATENALVAAEKANKCEVTRLSVDARTGYLSAEAVLKAAKPSTCLFTFILANNETGVVQPVLALCDRLRAARPALRIHTDAAQAVGKIDLTRALRHVDYISIVGHKFYGPRVGALVCRGLRRPDGARLRPMMFGGGQELSLRPGTENTPMIVGLGEAAKYVTNNIDDLNTHLESLRSHMEQRLMDSSVDCRIAFQSSTRLPNTCNVAFARLGCSSTQLLGKCEKFVASTGAACCTGQRASGILLAHGINEHLAARSFRLSVGRSTTRAEVDIAIDELLDVVQKHSI